MKGSVHRIRPPKGLGGHEQKGPRYGIVVQATRLEHLSTWVVVPTSSSPHARPGLLHPVVDFGLGESVALTEQLRAMDLSRLDQEVGFVSLASMQEIEKAIGFVLDLG